MATATKVATWVYRGRDLWGSYDTSQRFQSENDGCATMLDPHFYGWLRKPKSFTLDLINVCKQRGWQRLERMVELFHTMTEEERGYRLLQLWEAHGNALNKPLAMSVDEWAEKVHVGPPHPALSWHLRNAINRPFVHEMPVQAM
mgnify:CR=1 FL=1